MVRGNGRCGFSGVTRKFPSCVQFSSQEGTWRSDFRVRLIFDPHYPRPRDTAGAMSQENVEMLDRIYEDLFGGRTLGADMLAVDVEWLCGCS